MKPLAICSTSRARNGRGGPRAREGVLKRGRREVPQLGLPAVWIFRLLRRTGSQSHGPLGPSASIHLAYRRASTSTLTTCQDCRVQHAGERNSLTRSTRICVYRAEKVQQREKQQHHRGIKGGGGGGSGGGYGDSGEGALGGMDDHFPLPVGVDPERDSTIHGPRSAAGMSSRRSQSLYSPGPDLHGSRRSGVGDDVLDIEVRVGVCVCASCRLSACALSRGCVRMEGRAERRVSRTELARLPKRILSVCIRIVCDHVTRQATH
jgi:hypothetical protein